MYRGITVPIPVGLRGYNGTRNQAILQPGDLTAAQSVRFKDQAVRTAPGFVTVDANGVANANAECLAGLDYQIDSSTSRHITVWDDGIVYKEVSADLDSVELVNSITVTDPLVLVRAGQEGGSGNTKAFLFSGGEAPKVLDGDGASFAALTNVPSDWASSNPTFGVFHDYRMWAFAPGAYPHMCYASRLDDHSSFTGATDELDPPLFSIMPGVGLHISAAIPDPQQDSRRMYVFKYPYGIYSFDSTDVTNIFIPIDTISTGVGCAGPRAVCEVEGDIWFIGADAHIYSLAGVSTSQNVKRADITHMLNLTEYLRKEVDTTQAQLKWSLLRYDPARKEVWALYRKTTGVLNNRGFVIDVSDPQNPKVSTESRFEYGDLWLDRESRLYCGGASNEVGLQDIDDYEVLGSSFASIAEFAETDFAWVDPSLAQRKKRFDWLELEMIGQTVETELTITYIIDGKNYRSTTITIPTSGSPFGTVFSAPFILGGGIKATRFRIPIGGYGRRLGIKFTVSNPDQGFELIQKTIGFKPIGHPGEL